VWNGACVEYCGTSHANMRFKAFTVAETDFNSWIAHQQAMAQGSPAAAAPAGAAAAAPTQTTAGAPPVGGSPARATSSPAANAAGVGVPTTGATNTTSTTQVAQAGFVAFPRDKMPAYSVPQTPLPASLRFDDNALAAGNVASGEKLVTTGMCIACHSIRGEPMMVGNIGPNLTHVGSRTTIGAGLYPNDPQHLARWIKNANAMKPGIAMPTFGIGEYDPVTLKGPVKTGFTDQQIADIVAYLQSLK
jgi:cytochrome c oxidase subunit II